MKFKHELNFMKSFGIFSEQRSLYTVTEPGKPACTPTLPSEFGPFLLGHSSPFFTVVKNNDCTLHPLLFPSPFWFTPLEL